MQVYYKAKLVIKSNAPNLTR